MSSPTRCLMSAHEVFAVRRALEMSVDHGIARPESSISGRRRRAADSCRLPTMSRTDVEKCCSKESLELMPGIRMLRKVSRVRHSNLLAPGICQLLVVAL